MTEKEWMDIFADNLQGMLDEGNMTQKDLAEVTGLTQPSISNYLNKRRMPSVKALINISSFFGLSVDDLIYFGDTID